MFFKILALLLLMQGIEPFGYLSAGPDTEFFSSKTNLSRPISRREISNPKGIEPFGYLSPGSDTDLFSSKTNSSLPISRREILNPKGIKPLSVLSTGIKTDLFSLETKLSKLIFKREILNSKINKRDANSYRLGKEFENYKTKFQHSRTSKKMDYK
ncbi:uncharacterized protein LOC124806582 [Hydra vulgaris]|uniref:uncharacterized protein LOC124806582 n=1 Tax=Hydra vulgaris TaxID=6087 RepID=UPI001F5E38DC|nr:uncharacterized protein LOC124806582 [Hydra vulgaris]